MSDFKAIEIDEIIGAFDGGMNAGIPPVLLQRNQLAFLRNGTLRGLFPMPRPPYQTVTLNYGGDQSLQDAVETGLFQGACYYHPTNGFESLLASISGRLFQFVIVAGVATVIEQTNGNLQDTSVSQCWLWQAEKWVIWNDGINLPVFFDGNTTRRSLGASASLGTLTGQITLPAVGSAIAITLSVAYTGPNNVPIRIAPPVGVSGASLLFQVVSSVTGTDQYQFTAKTLFGSGIDASGSDVITKPNTIGILTAPNSLAGGAAFDYTVTMSDTSVANGLAAGTPINIKVGSTTYSVMLVSVISATQLRLHFPASSPTGFFLSNGVVTVPSITQPSVKVATLSAAYTVPAVGTSGTMKSTFAYTGGVGVNVWVGGHQYQVTAVPGITSSTTINVVLLTSPGSQTTLAAASQVFSIAELPAGRMGAYGLGQNWFSLTDGRSYMAGDIVGGSAGTPAYNYTDSVLKVSENSLLAGGGVFVVPESGGTVRAMRFMATLDSSLGQGPLQVLTPTIIFSCNVPVDRTLWKSVTNPIQTQTVISSGGLGQNSTVVWNSDLIYRGRNGIFSKTLARRDFNTWGDVPISNEVRTVIQADDKSLLPFASAITFDNRLLMTISPVNSGNGTYFTKLAVLNGDPISSLRGKAPAIYDGIWDGLNVLQLVTGGFAETDRAFAFTYSTDTGRIGLTEILPFGTSHFDNGSTRIVQEIELPMLPFNARARDPEGLLRLDDGELWCDQLDGPTKFETFFRPDYDTAWHAWYSWTVDPTNAATWQPRMGLGTPPNTSDNATDRPIREGHRFQVKVRVTGFARLFGGKFRAVTIPQPKPARQITN